MHPKAFARALWAVRRRWNPISPISPPQPPHTTRREGGSGFGRGSSVKTQNRRCATDDEEEGQEPVLPHQPLPPSPGETHLDQISRIPSDVRGADFPPRPHTKQGIGEIGEREMSDSNDRTPKSSGSLPVPDHPCPPGVCLLGIPFRPPPPPPPPPPERSQVMCFPVLGQDWTGGGVRPGVGRRRGYLTL